MMMELTDFLETHSKKYRTPDEATIGSAEPTPATTPAVTPGLLSSEVDVSFKSPLASQYPRISKKPHTPEVYEKKVVYLTPSTEWGEKSEKKSAETPSVPVTPPSRSASPTHIETVTSGSRQATPNIEHDELKENKSRELRSWNLGSAEKEGYSEDRALEPWEEENLQPAEKAEKEDEGLQRPSQENIASKE
ncbi:unnamed protein product [Cylicostephanus goldi]|uniref:Uncharacterized protein n=1 Tax=Cylicostephanus goldi TaxID=71465 RepID=A0A3P6R6K2_CYLGO|nr:unnamed protein product [Cylicostephanus goldi]